MSPVGDQKLCPICDSPLAEGSRKCGFCGTDLSIFEEDLGPPAAPPPPPTPAPSPPPAAPPGPPSAPAPPAVPLKAEELATFQCPECGATVDADASSCSSCGVGFAEAEGEAQFQCPECGTIVDAAAATCPGCGAIFAEAEAQPTPEAAAEERAEAPPEPAPEMGAPAEAAEAPAEERRGFFSRLSFRRRGRAEPEEAPPAPAPTPQAAPAPAVPAAPPARPVPSARLAPPSAAAPVPSPAPEGPRDLGRDLARLVADVKPLMALARDQAIEVTEGKELIDRAVLAGRDKQLDQAIELVTQARSVLSASFREHLSRHAGELEGEIGVARKLGADVAMASRYLAELRRASSEGDFQGSLAFGERIRTELQPHTGRYKESGRRIAELQSLIADAEVVYVDTSSARKLLTDANHAFGRMDYDAVESLTQKGTDSIVGAIPARIEDELRKGKELLVEAKMRGAKISGPITALKAATRSLKASRYIDALREIKQFKQEMRAL